MSKDEEYIINKKPSFWKEKLSKKEYRVLVKGSTDRAFGNKYYDNKNQGIYSCRACENVLFSSEDKYDSGSGWPSFSDVLFEGAVVKKPDYKLARERTEILCSRCGGHLGHLFRDGPEPTGLRYCMNSSSLIFLKNAYLASGCFWGPDAAFGAIDGVYYTASGYAGGNMKNPTYHNLGNHTETVRITYDPEKIDFTDLLNLFWENHNPYQKNNSSQYRSIIFFNDNQQKKSARNFIEKKKKKTDREIQTELNELNNFYEAEDYHQNYFLSQSKQLSQYLKKFVDLGERLTYSLIMTKLNAYAKGNLYRKEMIKVLNSSYLKLKDEDLIERIKGQLGEV